MNNKNSTITHYLADNYWQWKWISADDWQEYQGRQIQEHVIREKISLQN